MEPDAGSQAMFVEYLGKRLLAQVPYRGVVDILVCASAQ